jgi:hypothetical protein
MLTNFELQFMRDSIEMLMPDTCTILSPIDTPNDEGGIIQTWGTVAANVPCRLDMKSGSLPVTGGAVQLFTSYMLSIPYDQTIDEVDNVVINSIQYAVTSLNSEQSWRAVKRVTLEVVE